MRVDLLSLALDLGCYLLQVINPNSPAVEFLYIVQVLGYSLFCLFWFVFVLSFTRHSAYIRPRNFALLVALPILYISMMVLRWDQGSLANPPGTAIVGSLMSSPMTSGVPGLLFLIYGYGVAFFTIGILLQFYFKSDLPLRRLILPLLAGPLLLALSGVLELAGINPVTPFSTQQLACSMISFMAFWIIVDLRIGSIMANAREMVVEQIQDGVLILDQGERIVDLNPAAQQIMGTNGNNAIQQHLTQVWPAGASLLASRSEPDFSVGETTIQVNGVEYTFDINFSQLLDAYRQPIGRAIVLRNITGREQMEKELHERARQLQRANAFLAALAEVNLNIQTANDPSQINTILGSELNKLGLVCFIAQLDPASNELVISYFSRPEMVGKIEKLARVKLTGFRLDKDQFSKLYRILESNEISFRKFVPTDLQDGAGKVPVILLEQIFRLAGLEPDMAALILPLVTGRRTLGLMGIWGHNLGEGDIAPFRIFASQLAQVFDRDILYATEIKRSFELARANDLVIALSKVATLLGFTSNSDVVLDTLGKELDKAGLHCAVVTFDAAYETAFIKYLSFNPEVIKMIENLTGLQTKNYAVPKRFWPGDRIIKGQHPIWYPHPNEIFRKMFPSVPEGLGKKAFQILGFSDDDQLCILPLIIGDVTIGAMPIWGSDLKPSDSPILSVFSSQVAGIIQSVRAYENEIQRAGELARSNAMILALSKVAGRLDFTSNLAQVFDTLGNELKKAGLNCMVGTLDDAKQEIKIDYLSIAPEALDWNDRQGSYWSRMGTIPRRLWPTDKMITDKAPYLDPDPLRSAGKMFPFIPPRIFL